MQPHVIVVPVPTTCLHFAPDELAISQEFLDALPHVEGGLRLNVFMAQALAKMLEDVTVDPKQTLDPVDAEILKALRVFNAAYRRLERAAWTQLSAHRAIQKRREPHHGAQTRVHGATREPGRRVGSPRKTSSTSSSSSGLERPRPSSSDDDPDLVRACAGCAVEFTPTRRGQRFHDERCATAARVRRHRNRQNAELDELLLQRSEAACQLVAAGELSSWDALREVICPGQRLEQRQRAAA